MIPPIGILNAHESLIGILNAPGSLIGILIPPIGILNAHESHIGILNAPGLLIGILIVHRYVLLIRSCHCECVLVIYDLLRKIVRKTPVSEYVLRVGRLGHPHFQGGQWVDIIGQWSSFA